MTRLARRSFLLLGAAAALAACDAPAPRQDRPDAPPPAPPPPEPAPDPQPAPEPEPAPEPAPEHAEAPAPSSPRSPRFIRCHANVRVSEGGNDDDPHDRGGRTSRGITQREWSKWRRAHPGLPADVWRAPEAHIEAIYRAWYWDAMRCEELPAGLDYTIFDFSVHSGVERVGRLGRAALGLATDDWRITDAMLRALNRYPTTTLIVEINDRRRRFLSDIAVGSQAKYRNGWLARVAAVKRISLRMADPVVALIDLPDDPAFGPGKTYAARRGL
jgi:lysozyme family protein